MNNENFKWLTKDIDSSLVLRVIDKKSNINDDNYVIFNVKDVLNVIGDKLNVETANIDDLTNLLTIGIVRFTNIDNINDVLDIPFRNLYMLYSDGNFLGDNIQKSISSSKLDSFLVVDGDVRDEFLIFSLIIDKVSDDLDKVMEIASKFGEYGMQEKFDALTNLTLINHRRLLSDSKNSMLR